MSHPDFPIVQINLQPYGHGTIAIDGHPIHARAILIAAEVDGLTIVTLTMAAHVTGTVRGQVVEDQDRGPSPTPCPCAQPFEGSWCNLPPDRLKPYGLDGYSTTKGCALCGGTGRPSGDGPTWPGEIWQTRPGESPQDVVDRLDGMDAQAQDGTHDDTRGGATEIAAAAFIASPQGETWRHVLDGLEGDAIPSDLPDAP